MRLLKQSTVADGGSRDDKEQVYTSVLTKVESKRFADNNGCADFWKGKTLAWVPHFDKPKM